MPADPASRTKKQLVAENQDLRARLEEAEETLRAIRSGEVDALVVSGQGGEQVYTLKGADRPYRELIEDMNDGALTLSLDGTILYANRRLAEMLKMPLEKVIGSAIRTWIAPGDRRVLQSLLEKSAAEKRSAQLALAASDGTQVTVGISVNRPLRSGAPDSFCLVASDLTEQMERNAALVAAEKSARDLLAISNQSRLALLSLIEDQKRTDAEIQRLNAELEQRVLQRTAQLQAANQELEAFSYSVSHDLRQPLRAIAGFASIVLEKNARALDEEGKRRLEVIRANIYKMGQLINDLLAFSRLSRVQMALAAVDLAALADSVFSEIKSLEKGRAIEFTVSDLPRARGDQALLRLVLQNLLANAVKFTRPRSPARIELSGQAGNGVNTYQVKDNGVGFDMAYVHKLFGVFQRLHDSKEFEGTGVGLAIVQRIVQRHGGRAWAESGPEAGADFLFHPARRRRR